MDALREQYEGGFKMSAYKDKTQGTWYVSFRYVDWTGKKTQKLKRGKSTLEEIAADTQMPIEQVERIKKEQQL